MSTLTVPALAVTALLATAVGQSAPVPNAGQGYQPYSAAAFDAAKSKRRILFFHATWCPNCRADETDILKNLASIPKDLVIFKADFDKETALKQQYGIPVQDTFVLVDAQGRALKKWAGSGLRGGGLKDILAAASAKKM